MADSDSTSFETPLAGKTKLKLLSDASRTLCLPDTEQTACTGRRLHATNPSTAERMRMTMGRTMATTVRRLTPGKTFASEAELVTNATG
jgi:hypothetical protein